MLKINERNINTRMEGDIGLSVVDCYFRDNPLGLVQHQLASFDDFYKKGIFRIFAERNPIRISKNQDPTTGEFRLRANLYLGGKDGTSIYFGKPTIHDEEGPDIMYPNVARLRSMTYAMSIHYDVHVEYFVAQDGKSVPAEPTHSSVLERVFLGRFPIMLLSNYCVLKGLTPSMRFQLGECRNDYGAYFIIDGKEKCIVSQERFADNMLYVRGAIADKFLASAEIRSVSDDASKAVRTARVRVVAPTPNKQNGNIVVNVPNIKKPVPLFILMRALGVESDKEIIDFCLLDTAKYETYMELFVPSVHDGGQIFSQSLALKYLATLTRNKTVPHVLEILSDYFLPHIGELNFREKAYFVGHMVREALRVMTGEKKPTDRDSFRYKRIDEPGRLLYDLFKEYYSLQQRLIYQKIDKEYYYKQGVYTKDFIKLIDGNKKEIFAERSVESGFRKAFKGNWGASPQTKRMGIVQDLNRLSYNAALSHVRKINLPLDSSAKVIGPRLLAGSQWGIIDPVDTPDGGNVGLHKHMSILAKITTRTSPDPCLTLLSRSCNMMELSNMSPRQASAMTKVVVNGRWIGGVSDPRECTQRLRAERRIGKIDPFISVLWAIEEGTLYVNTDAGRLCRPVFYVSDGTPSFDESNVKGALRDKTAEWTRLVHGSPSAPAVVEYLDTAEAEGALIAFDVEKLDSAPYTHLEVHPSLIFGVMGNQVVFPENNQLPRDLFACGQMRQAVSLYHSNYQTRIDKMGVVLNNGQTPLVKSRYLDKISKEQHPYGENAIVAIMCYGGYNVEDSILVNKGAIDRGIFRTTYFNMYEDREESSTVGGTQVDSRFARVSEEAVAGLRPGYDYEDLGKDGLIAEGTVLDDKRVVIGKITTNVEDPDVGIDSSTFAKKGQLGIVDKSFITTGDEGFRIAKVRVRHERVPAIGDKFCSRCGQKGTIGLIIDEANMPFTKDGIRPDIIVNPHALPSRMTIGQLVECLMGKACAHHGSFGDCTAFTNKGQKATEFGDLLTSYGYASSGCEILYNGESGEAIESDIFIGPTYYMRLKHMVKDKINYRARGPRTVLTRQTVQGRANDGGLRIGEMERDTILAHGASKFLQESMLERGDKYFMAVCDETGMVAVYNETNDLFLSPYADGPLKFEGNLGDGLNIVKITKHGRRFSVLRIPYSLKLLMQELQTMGVQMRLITESGMDQLASMGFRKSLRVKRKSVPAAGDDGSGLRIGSPAEIQVESLEEPSAAPPMTPAPTEPPPPSPEPDALAASARMVAQLRAETQRAEAVASQLANAPALPGPAEPEGEQATNRESAGVSLRILGDVATPSPLPAPAPSSPSQATKTIVVPPELK